MSIGLDMSHENPRSKRMLCNIESQPHRNRTDVQDLRVYEQAELTASPTVAFYQVVFLANS